MTKQANQTSDGPFKGHHFLFILLGLFAIVFGVNVYFTTKAVTTFPGEAVPKSYIQGLKYNEQLEARATQAALNWRAEVGTTGTAAAPVLIARFLDADTPIRGLDVDADLVRLTTDEGRQQVQLSATTSGDYAYELPALAPGVWDVKVTATDAQGQTFEARKRIILK